MGRAMAPMGGAGGGDDVKDSWPEVVGMIVPLAVIKIRVDRPDVNMEIHSVGDHVAPGYNGHRVRLFLDPDTAKVAQTPVVG